MQCISNIKHFNEESEVLSDIYEGCGNKGQVSLQQDYQPKALKRVVLQKLP